MARIRGLELVFNLEKNNFKSAADCAVVALHCLLINEGLQCLGTGDEWNDLVSATSSELLPKEWNSDQDVYSLRYISRDRASRILLKICKADHMLLVNAVKNENVVSSMSFPVSSYVSENYTDYSTTYIDLESLVDSFRKDIMDVLTNKPSDKPKEQDKLPYSNPSTMPSAPSRPSYIPPYQTDPERFVLPSVGGNDLDPFAGPGRGGMFMDPSDFRVPSRPSLPQFGVGGPGGLPRGAVPPGARFDPFMPPIGPSGFNPNPDHFRPPSDYDFI